MRLSGGQDKRRAGAAEVARRQLGAGQWSGAGPAGAAKTRTGQQRSKDFGRGLGLRINIGVAGDVGAKAAGGGVPWLVDNRR